jgi:hypothetical protein
VAGSCDHGNEVSGSLEGRERRNLLSDYLLFQTDFTKHLAILVHGTWS